MNKGSNLLNDIFLARIFVLWHLKNVFCDLLYCWLNEVPCAMISTGGGKILFIIDRFGFSYIYYYWSDLSH